MALCYEHLISTVGKDDQKCSDPGLYCLWHLIYYLPPQISQYHLGTLHARNIDVYLLLSKTIDVCALE